MSVDDVLEQLDRLLERRLGALEPFTAVVTSLSNGKVAIKRTGQDTADTQLYARVFGFDLAVNDEVLCLPLGTQPIVIGKLQRSTPSWFAINGAPVAPAPLVYFSGSYYGGLTTLGSRAASTLAVTANYVYFVPVIFPKDGTVTALSVEVTATSTNTVRLGLYDATGTDDLPGARLVQSTTISVTTTGAKEATGLSQAVKASTLYWLAVGCVATPTLRAMTPSKDCAGLATNLATVGTGGVVQTSGVTVSSGFPATAGTVTGLSGDYPHVLAKMS